MFFQSRQILANIKKIESKDDQMITSYAQAARKGIVASEKFRQIMKEKQIEARQIKASSYNQIIHVLHERTEDEDKTLIEYGVFNQIIGLDGVKIIKNRRIGVKKTY